jgi:hypothetical protein
VTNSNSKTLPQRSMDVNVQSTILPFVLVDERPSPFARAEAIKRRYMTELDKLLIAYEREIAESLANADFSQTYRLAEADAYLHRLGRIVRAHERQTSERAARAELAERGAAWVDAVSPKTN